MKNQIAILATALAILIISTAEAVEVFNENIQIENATPGIILEDTDAQGEEWHIFGLEENFSIVDVGVGDVLIIDPVKEATAMGYGAAATGNFSTALGDGANASGFISAALGYNAWASGSFSTALGYLASSIGVPSTALGSNASAGGDYSVALGDSTLSVGNNSIALGHSASTGGNSSIAMGFNASAAGESVIALGQLSSAEGENSIALGYLATAYGHFSTAVGYEVYAVGEYSTAVGYRTVAPNPNTIVLGAIAGVNGASSYANIGMGTNTPVQAVDVERSGAAARFQLTSFADTATDAPQFIQRRSRGTSTSAAAVQNNDNLGLFSFRGYNGSTMGGSRATITAQAAGNFTDTSTPTRLIFATTPVGQTTPQQVLVITPDGKVQVNGQNLSVPDYVFEDDYELMPLAELRDFIDDNGHLPGIAPAQEVNAEGLDLAGSQMGLLRKVEELTLYTLQQERRLAAQDSEMDTMRTELAELRRLVQASSP